MQIETDRLTPLQAVVHPIGRMDVESSPLVRQTLLDLVDQGLQIVVVDLDQVDFMDSSGLSALVSGMKALRKTGGRLGVCRANAQIRTALRLTMLDRVFPVHETAQQAILTLSSPETETPE